MEATEEFGAVCAMNGHEGQHEAKNQKAAKGNERKLAINGT